MLVKMSRYVAAVVLFGLCICWSEPSPSQEPSPVRLEAPQEPAALAKGVEVQARGPIHEAFASPSTEPKATQPIAKKPPTPIEEMPPEDRPDGEVAWIGGYWSWDEDRNDFMWVSGCWRVKPASKDWVPGYWREVGEQWQWVPGFWAAAQAGKVESITYYPEPPAPPNVAPAGDAPGGDMFYVPGYWMWNGDRYAWRVGYWNRVRPGYVYVASHYRWTPQGYVLVAGYWDLAVSRRGVLYAPVYVDAVIVGPGYVYTPCYAIRDTLVLDTMFIRPVACSYYFGDYYGPRYVAFGFEPLVVYSRRHYEPIIVYERWHYRDNPRWFDAQLTLVVERNAGRAALPPRVINVTNITVVNNYIAPTRTIMAAQGVKTVRMDVATRNVVRERAVVANKAFTAERHRNEIGGTGVAGAALAKPKATSFNVPAAHQVGSSGAVGTAGITAKTQPGHPLVTTPVHPLATTPVHPMVTNPMVTRPNPTPKGPPIIPKKAPEKKKAP